MEDISKLLEQGSSQEKIRVIETLTKTDDPDILKMIVSKLDDSSIRVRGEAFSCLILHQNDISDMLIASLESASPNIRGFTSLVLANRVDIDAIPHIVKLADDESSMVRSCVQGALCHLQAQGEKETILKGLADSDIEVVKSALQGAIKLRIPILQGTIEKTLKVQDSEVYEMISKIKSGPEGI